VQFNGEGREMRSSPLVRFALAVTLPVACSNGSSDTATCATFRTSLSVKDRMSQAANVFNPNEPITFELAIANTRNAPTTLTASSSCTAVVFEVTDSAHRRRWGSADQIACIQMLQPRAFAPLETVNESVSWDQKDSDDATVAPGTYVVTAAVGQYVSDSGGLVDCRVELGKSASFTIQ
jgi:hypothetical protein